MRRASFFNARWLAVVALFGAACGGQIADSGGAGPGGNAGAGAQQQPGGAGAGGPNVGSAGNGAVGAAGVGGPLGTAGMAATAGTGGSTTVPPPEVKPPFVQPDFTCKPNTQSAIPRRLWRLTPDQHRNAIASFFSGRFKGTETDFRKDPPKVLISPFTSGGGSDRFTSFDTPTVGDFEFRGAINGADALAQEFVRIQVERGGTCYFQNATPATKGCVRETLVERGGVLFGRPLTDAELDAYDKLAKDSVKDLGEREACVTAFQAFFTSPQFLYRNELGVVSGETAKLSQFEIASALSYTLIDFPPDEPLWAAAMAGSLGTSEQIKMQVVRLLNGYGGISKNNALRRFFAEYFRYGRVLQVFKDTKDFPEHRPERLNGETETLIADILSTNGRKDLLKALLSTNVGFYSYHQNYNTAIVYGIDVTGVAKNDLYNRFTFPAAERAGILTQPSFMVGFSEPDHNQTVQRGRFIAESLLCQSVPELAIGQVPPLPDLGPKATMREKLAQHSKGSCASCHKMMDHLGLAFETYDHLGRYRKVEFGDKTIDPSGTLGDETGAPGPFANAVELTKKLSTSPVVEQCFVRHAFRNFFGRFEGEADGCSLVAAYDAYRKGGGDFVEMLATLLSSSSSLFRTTK